MAFRKFQIFYPELGVSDEQTVNVEPGEYPEHAIVREGNVVGEWIMLAELPMD